MIMQTSHLQVQKDTYRLRNAMTISNHWRCRQDRQELKKMLYTTAGSLLKSITWKSMKQAKANTQLKNSREAAFHLSQLHKILVSEYTRLHIYNNLLQLNYIYTK